MAKKPTVARLSESATSVTTETKPGQTLQVHRPTAEQTKLAIKAICCITGCGRLEAESRTRDMPPGTVLKIAQLEADGKRREVIPILY